MPEDYNYIINPNKTKVMLFRETNGYRSSMPPRKGDTALRKTKSTYWLMFRFTAFFMLVACMQVYARSNAQEKITLNRENIPFRQLLKEIKNRSGYLFVYKDDILRGIPNKNIHTKEANLKDVMEAVLQGTDLTYSIIDKTVVLKRAVVVSAKNNQDSAFANEVVAYPPIHGQVTDSTGTPLPNVTVLVKGTKYVTVTDNNGNYTFADVDPADAVLVFSFVGYTTQEVSMHGKLKLDIVLNVLVSNIEETVVIGYGSTRKKDLTGSISTIDPKNIQNIPFVTIDNALAGKAAGVQVTKTDGTPGGAVRVRVRGSTSLIGGNDPLYVIDGVPFQIQSNYISPGFDVITPSGNSVNSGLGGISVGMQASYVNGLNSLGGLNIEDIESISILKDAAATAIYGSKAANGVVMITTKTGRKSMDPTITFNNYITYSRPILPHLLDVDQYKLLLLESARNDSIYRASAKLSQNSTVKQILAPNYFGQANTNWLDLITRNTLSHNGQLSIQGGGSNTKYYSSIAYTTSPGVIKGSTYKRVSGKLNLENEISKHLKFTTNMDIGYINQDITNGAYSTALSARPDLAPYDSVGNFTSFASLGYSYQGFQNPLAMLTAINKANTFSLLGSLNLSYHFNPYWEFKSMVSLNMQTYNQRNYTPSYLSVSTSYTYTGNGIGSNSNRRFANWFVENTLTYNKKFNEYNSINLLAGTSYETKKTSYFNTTAAGYPNDNILNNLSSAVNILSAQGDDPSKPQSYMISYYLRTNYGYKDKYLVSFTGRTDGSSKFGPENKYGFFPSVALAWRISKERFLKDYDWIDDIKLRTSYGTTGTQNIGDQMYRTLYTPYSYNGINAIVPTQLGNPSIRWETTNEGNLGIDFSFYNRRIMGTFDLYSKKTNNALISMPLVPSAVYSTLLGNFANLRTTGYELALEGDILRANNFTWHSTFNITWSTTIVTKLSAGSNLSKIGNYSGVEINNTALIEGQPLGLITGNKITGIIQNTEELASYKAKLNLFASNYKYLNLGDPMYLLDTITYAAYNSATPTNSTIIGHGAPKYYGGFTQEFSFQKFSLNFYFTYSKGGQLLWGEGTNSMSFNGTSNANVLMLERWTSEHTNTNRPRLLYSDLVVPSSNLNVYSSSYLKLRTLSFNYNINKSERLRKAGIQSWSVFASANNLFTITSYPGLDPEVSDDSYSVAGGYLDINNFPSIKSYTVGLKIMF